MPGRGRVTVVAAGVRAAQGKGCRGKSDRPEATSPGGRRFCPGSCRRVRDHGLGQGRGQIEFAEGAGAGLG